MNRTNPPVLVVGTRPGLTRPTSRVREKPSGEKPSGEKPSGEPFGEKAVREEASEEA